MIKEGVLAGNVLTAIILVMQFGRFSFMLHIHCCFSHLLNVVKSVENKELGVSWLLFPSFKLSFYFFSPDMAFRSRPFIA